MKQAGQLVADSAAYRSIGLAKPLRSRQRNQNLPNWNLNYTNSWVLLMRLMNFFRMRQPWRLSLPGGLQERAALRLMLLSWQAAGRGSALGSPILMLLSPSTKQM